MKLWIKRSLWTLLAVVLLLGGTAYYQLRSMGVFPRYDYDTEPPTLPTFSKPAVLVFTKTTESAPTIMLPVASDLMGKRLQRLGW